MTPTARAYITEVRSLPCVLCTKLGRRQETPTEAHHIREGQGISQRASDFLTVALCHECHQGPLGIHGNRTLLKLAKVSELDLLAATIEAMFRRCQA